MFGSDTIYKRVDNEINMRATRIHFIVLKIIAPSYALPAILQTIFKFVLSNGSKDSFQQTVPGA